MQLSSLGEIAYSQGLKLPKYFMNIFLDAFVMMPNHMHGIIVITDVDDDQKGRGEAGDMGYASQSIIPKSPASPLRYVYQPLRPIRQNRQIDLVRIIR